MTKASEIISIAFFSEKVNILICLQDWANQKLNNCVSAHLRAYSSISEQFAKWKKWVFLGNYHF